MADAATTEPRRPNERPGIETAPPKKCLLARNDRLSDVLAKKLKEDCSPQQICGWLVSHYPDDEAMGVSAETIYRTLFVQAKDALKKELLAHLRSRRTMRSSRHARTSGPQARSDQRQSKTAVSIRNRPAEAEDRVLPRHFGKGTCSQERTTPTLLPCSKAELLVRDGGAPERQGHRKRRRGFE